MDQATMQFLLDAARQEAEQSWQEGGIPIGAVLANAGRRRDWRELTLVTTLSPCPMCAGTAVLLGFRRVVIGERKSFKEPNGGCAKPASRCTAWTMPPAKR